MVDVPFIIEYADSMPKSFGGVLPDALWWAAVSSGWLSMRLCCCFECSLLYSGSVAGVLAFRGVRCCLTFYAVPIVSDQLSGRIKDVTVFCAESVHLSILCCFFLVYM